MSNKMTPRGPKCYAKGGVVGAIPKKGFKPPKPAKAPNVAAPSKLSMALESQKNPL